MLPHTTGVEQNYVGIPDLGSQLETLFTQAGDDHLAVKHIHLATNSLNVQTLIH
jgi:hypothetical protein